MFSTTKKNFIDENSFEILDKNLDIAKDNKNVYQLRCVEFDLAGNQEIYNPDFENYNYNLRIIKNADPKNFEIIWVGDSQYSTDDNYFFKDKNHVWQQRNLRECELIKELNPDTFRGEVLGYYSYGITLFDDKSVYCFDRFKNIYKKVKEVDLSQFKLIARNIYKGEDGIYYYHTEKFKMVKEEEVDKDSFKEIPGTHGYLFKDQYSLFYYHSSIDEVFKIKKIKNFDLIDSLIYSKYSYHYLKNKDKILRVMENSKPIEITGEEVEEVNKKNFKKLN